MIVHGGQDKRVPVEHAKELKRVLDENHRSYEWLVEDGEGHGFYKTAHQLDMYTKLLAFLDKQIGAGATAAPKPAAATQ
jgi:dipeptidyl aminopeptidase/acylaminoacyl peptidase